VNACCRNVDPWRHLVGSWRTFASSAGRNTDMSSPLPTHRHKSWLPPPLPLQLQQQLLLLILQYGPKSRTCLSVDNSVKVTRRKACDMSKVLECCRQNGPNLHNKSFNYSLPNLHKSLLPLKLGICLHSHVPKFIELKNPLPKSPHLNYVNYSVWDIATDSMVTKFQ